MMMDGLLIFNLVKRLKWKKYITEGKSAIGSHFFFIHSISLIFYDERFINSELQFFSVVMYGVACVFFYFIVRKQIDEWHDNCNVFDHSELSSISLYLLEWSVPFFSLL